MGYYINEINGKSLPARGKATALLNAGAKKLAGPVVFQPDLVCVVENGVFDAAGFAYSESEMRQFLINDERPKTWLIVENASKWSGYDEK